MQPCLTLNTRSSSKIIDKESPMSCVTKYEPNTNHSSVTAFDAELHDLMPPDLTHSAEDLMDICIWQTDSDAVFTKLSSTCIRVFKSHPAILIGRNMLDCLDDDEWANERDDMEAMFDGRYTFRSMSVTFEVFPGRSLILFVSGAPTYDQETGKFTGYRGIARCTEQHCSAPVTEEQDHVNSDLLLDLLTEVAEFEMQDSRKSTDTGKMETISTQIDSLTYFLSRLGLGKCKGMKKQLFELRDLSVSINCHNYCSERVRLMTNPDVFETAIKELCAESSAEKIPVITLARNTVSESLLKVEIDRCSSASDHNLESKSDSGAGAPHSDKTGLGGFGPYIAAAMLDSLGIDLSWTIINPCRVSYTISIPSHYVIRDT